MGIKKGDIVGRISYNKDIIFVVEKVINKSNAMLKGLTIRVQADSPITDLEKIDKNEVYKTIKNLQDNLDKRIKQNNISKRDINKIYTGKILHLDGDKKYSEKSLRYYNKMGLNAIVKNIPESRQPQVVYQLLQRYNPDILIITGHDAMLKNGRNYNDIYNYRNSKYFINSVREARRWGANSDKLVVFAGACQSYFEAIMNAGADFASSPGRILIDFIDPLVVAEKIALTESYKIVTIDDIIAELKDGKDGIGGTATRGRKQQM